MFKKKLPLFLVTYEFDGEIITHTATSAGLASLDADPYVTILIVEKL